ncbi:RNA 2',3'-cyclic phosphodiesterase [Candidatus Woesearchaeota archaeon]|nr:RNA 2',3'-cyclic phosphodiesterase [Candidatus Woesearchaeota archaeon]
MRLFIAIDFNELKSYFIELQKLLPNNARLSLVRSFHLTLKFLGEVQPNKADEIIRILNGIEFEKFGAFTDSIGIFPTENYIRVVWVGLKPEEKILELQQKVDESLKNMFKKEKDFQPHITLARVKRPEDKKSFVKEINKINVENKKIEIKDFRLVKSTLSPKGPVYEDLEVFNQHLGSNRS